MSPDPDPPTARPSIPDDVARELADLTGCQLRHTAEFVQDLLGYREEAIPARVEAGPGEEIVRVAEHDTHTEVVKREPCAEGCADCPHGPYLYHVSRERSPNGGEHLHWTYVGRVVE